MRIHHYQSGEPRQRISAVAASESFGRIAARRPNTASLTRVVVAPPAAATAVVPVSVRSEAAARAHRARQVGDLAAAVLGRLVAAARRLLAAWQRRRQQRATVLALQGLDDRTLHDLGFARGEIPSVALDSGRDDVSTRRRAPRAATALRLSATKEIS